MIVYFVFKYHTFNYVEKKDTLLHGKVCDNDAVKPRNKMSRESTLFTCVIFVENNRLIYH